MRETCTSSQRSLEMERPEDQGFMLVGLIVAIFFVLLALSVAAPKVAQALRREREVEAVHRGNQYVRAIRLYYRRFGHYPGSMEQLEKTNNIRFLRQQYVDPITGKADWRLIKVGEAKTTVKGFFGQPLAGLTPGLGSAAGNASAGPAGAGAAGSGGYGSSSPSAFGGSSPSAFGGSGGGGLGSSSPGTGGIGSSSSGLGGSSSLPTLGGSSTTGGATGGAAGNGPPTLGGSSSSGSGQGSGPTGSGPTGSGPGSTSGLGSLSGNASDGGATSGGTPFVGVGVPKEEDSIRVLNEQTTYNTWEFLYDPRIEQLYAKGALMGGGPTGLGSAGGNSSGFGNTPGSGFGNTPGSGFGNTPGSGFGNTPGSGYGTTPGLGSSPGSSSPTAPSAPSAPPQPPQE